jgi:mannonate dehydratase
LYNLLGGKSREKVMVYAHANGKNLDDTLQKTGIEREKGFRAIRVQSGVPGITDTYGVARDSKFYEPAHKGLPHVEYWDTAKYLNYIPRLFETVREAFGSDVHLLHDVHHRCTHKQHAGKRTGTIPLFWLEDPVSGELQEGLRLIRKYSTTPLQLVKSLTRCMIIQR